MRTIHSFRLTVLKTQGCDLAGNPQWFYLHGRHGVYWDWLFLQSNHRAILQHTAKSILGAICSSSSICLDITESCDTQWVKKKECKWSVTGRWRTEGNIYQYQVLKGWIWDTEHWWLKDKQHWQWVIIIKLNSVGKITQGCTAEPHCIREQASSDNYAATWTV